MRNIENPVQKKAEETIDNKMRAFLSDVYNNNQTPDERLGAILKRLAPFLSFEEDSGLDHSIIDEIKNNLEVYTKIIDQDEAISKIMICLEPLFMWQENEPKSFEARMRKAFIAESGFMPLNEMLSYGQEKDHVHIHVAPSETIDIKEKFILLQDGFKKLAEILKNNPDIKEVRATSWIVANSPDLMEKKLGFTIKGEISEEDKKKYFRNESENNIPVHEASIDRDDFINRYGR